MKHHLSIFYTNNAVSPGLMTLCMEKVYTSVMYAQSKWGIGGYSFSFVRVSPDANYAPMHKGYHIKAPELILNKGYLSIMEKIRMALDVHPEADTISLHEHDCLYPDVYLARVIESFESLPFVDCVFWEQIVGVCAEGYQSRIVYDRPFSGYSFRRDTLTMLLRHKKHEYKENGGYCYLEPGYGGSWGSMLHTGRCSAGGDPIVHVNMNKTSRNHHFTSPYSTYNPEADLPEQWPGDLSHLFI